MRATTKRLLVAYGLYLAIQIPDAVVSVIYGLTEDLPFSELGNPDDVLSERY